VKIVLNLDPSLRADGQFMVLFKCMWMLSVSLVSMKEGIDVYLALKEGLKHDQNQVADMLPMEILAIIISFL